MKNKKNLNLFYRTVLFLSVLILIIVITAIGLFYYMFSIPEPEGLSLASWPQTFANSFSVWTTYENGELSIRETGLKRLDEYGLWIQFIDESGEEFFSYHKPEDYPTKYSASELMALGTSDYEKGNTVFVNSLNDHGETYNYIVGFPYDIGRYVLHYNGDRMSRLYPATRIIIFFSFIAFIAFVLGYTFWLSRRLTKVTDSIRELSFRDYIPIKEKGVFREIYAALNKMNRELKDADAVKEETERTRREWITNITHDLKTPLSPVKGYAELLADGAIKETEEIQECGRIILKNIDYTEHLINDLKLTYQLECGSIPYSPKEVYITRYIKEWIIDIINDPLLSERDIEFDSNAPDLVVRIDTDLFRRVVQNLIINALTHNPADTKVKVMVDSSHKNGITISICDNGTGIRESELSELFTRYYRGTSTKEKTEGSGLGLAIANQIVILHNGEITVNSKKNEGTEFIIFLPV